MKVTKKQLQEMIGKAMTGLPKFYYLDKTPEEKKKARDLAIQTFRHLEAAEDGVDSLIMNFGVNIPEGDQELGAMHRDIKAFLKEFVKQEKKD